MSGARKSTTGSCRFNMKANSSALTLLAVVMVFDGCTSVIASPPDIAKTLGKDESKALKAAVGTMSDAQSVADVNEKKHGGPCHQNKSNSCPLHDMAPGTSNIVYPEGDKAKCIEGPFAFRVQTGDSDKLLIYLQGGGACAGPLAMCTTDINQGGIAESTGIFDKSNSLNPFSSYTIITVPYCSGDAFLGNISGGTYGNQFGYFLANMVVEWAASNFPQTLSSLVLSGDSAGAIGTQMWARHVLKTFKYERASVLADSFAGAFVPGVLSALGNFWNTCNLPVLSSDIQAKCKGGDLAAADPFIEAMEEFPCVRFGSLQTKADSTQIFFYCGTLPTLEMQANCVQTFDGAALYQLTNQIFEKFSKMDNWVPFIINGEHHIFLGLPEFYTASTAGALVAPDAAFSVMAGWVGRFVGAKEASTECKGPYNKSADASGTQYCDINLKGLSTAAISMQAACATTTTTSAPVATTTTSTPVATTTTSTPVAATTTSTPMADPCAPTVSTPTPGQDPCAPAATPPSARLYLNREDSGKATNAPGLSPVLVFATLAVVLPATTVLSFLAGSRYLTSREQTAARDAELLESGAQE